jgi:hypothetical protein
MVSEGTSTGTEKNDHFSVGRNFPFYIYGDLRYSWPVLHITASIAAAGMHSNEPSNSQMVREIASFFYKLLR